MKRLSRRDLCVALPALATSSVAASAAQTIVPPPTNRLGEAKTFPFDHMTTRALANGGESRDALRGTLLSGEVVAVHESTLPVGAPPNPRHTIAHSELILIREGEVAFEHAETSEKVGAGGVIYVALGTPHALRNVGTVPAKYFVVQIGGDTRG